MKSVVVIIAGQSHPFWISTPRLLTYNWARNGLDPQSLAVELSSQLIWKGRLALWRHFICPRSGVLNLHAVTLFVGNQLSLLQGVTYAILHIRYLQLVTAAQWQLGSSDEIILRLGGSPHEELYKRVVALGRLGTTVLGLGRFQCQLLTLGDYISAGHKTHWSSRGKTQFIYTCDIVFIKCGSIAFLTWGQRFQFHKNYQPFTSVSIIVLNLFLFKPLSHLSINFSPPPSYLARERLDNIKYVHNKIEFPCHFPCDVEYGLLWSESETEDKRTHYANLRFVGRTGNPWTHTWLIWNKM